jgi:hypothetical protein
MPCSKILAFELPTIGASTLAVLLDQARKKTIRVWAEQSPFDLKDVLKRGYRWCDGSDGRPRSWHIDVGEDQLGNEIAFLKTEIYHLRSGAAIADLDGAQPIFRQSVDRENSRSTSPPDGENVGFETESLPTHGG